MFPSTKINETFTKSPNPNPNSIQPQAESPPLFSHFPSPFLDDYTDFFSPQENFISTYNDSNIVPSNFFSPQENFISTYNDSNIVPSNPSQPSSSSPPLKKNRKDRHSKIFTAQGVRARRLRLPLQIAERFFHLQDMLGFDKASKTIEWLLAKSKGAIKEITRNIPTSFNGDQSSCGLFSDSREGSLKKKRDLARAKARARARARTREKMNMRSIAKIVELGPSSSNPNPSFDSNIVGVNGNYCSNNENYNLLDYFLQNWEAENEMIGY